jgi:hypothetical protein
MTLIDATDLCRLQFRTQSSLLLPFVLTRSSHSCVEGVEKTPSAPEKKVAVKLKNRKWLNWGAEGQTVQRCRITS